MKILKLFLYTNYANGQTVSLLPPTQIEYKQTHTRLVADEGYFLSNGKEMHYCIDVPNEEIELWQELSKEEFKDLF